MKNNKQTKQSKNNKRIRICFVASDVFPLLTGEKTKDIIGPDVHQVILAKELRKHDFKINFINNRSEYQTSELQSQNTISY